MDIDSQSRQLERRFGPIFRLGKIHPFWNMFEGRRWKLNAVNHIGLVLVADPNLDHTVASLKPMGSSSSAGMEPGFHTWSLQ